MLKIALPGAHALYQAFHLVGHARFLVLGGRLLARENFQRDADFPQNFLAGFVIRAMFPVVLQPVSINAAGYFLMLLPKGFRGLRVLRPGCACLHPMLQVRPALPLLAFPLLSLRSFLLDGGVTNFAL